MSPIDSDISHTIQSALSKVFDKGKTQINISVEKEQGKRKSFYLWKKNGYFNSQVCDFLLEEAKLLENTVFYINQGFLSWKDNIYYVDLFVIGQIVPFLNQPVNLEQYAPKDNEVKLLCPKYAAFFLV